MSAIIDERTHPADEGSDAAVQILLAIRRNGGAASGQLLLRLTRLTPHDLGEALHGLQMRGRVWYDERWGGIGAWRLGVRR